MNTETVVKKINDIVSDDNYGLEVFALLHKDKFLIEKFQINSRLEDLLKEKVKNLLNSNYLTDEFLLDSVDNIADNKKIFYEIQQNSDYFPFSFLNTNFDELEKYAEKEQPNLKGFFYKDKSK